MRKVIHIVILLSMTGLTSFIASAGDLDTFQTNTRKDTLLEKNVTDSISLSKKVCSCQLVNVKTEKYGSELVAIFAEKTLEGKAIKNYRILDEYIRREAIYFRIAFLESLNHERSFRVANDCSSLYKELKLKHAGLRMYNIIDVDALTALAKR